MKFPTTGLTMCSVMFMTIAAGARADQGASMPAAPTAASTATPIAAPMASSAGAASSKSADRALRRRVLTALSKAKGLRASGITVRVRDGAVVLEGWVPEEAQIDRATQVAQAVPGVTSVKNVLTLSTF